MPKQSLPGPGGPAAEIPQPGTGKRGEQGHLGYLLRQANTVLRVQMERALAEFGVTPPQFVVLTMLSAYPGASNADIARLSLLTPQTVSVIIANLEKSALIERVPHAQHGRIRQIRATRAGSALLVRCRRRVAAIERRLVDGLQADEEAIIRRWLAGIARDA